MSGFWSDIEAINNNEYKKVESSYAPFIVNRNFSLFRETIFIANEANMFGNSVTLQQHFDYYLGLLTKRRRYKKWPQKLEIPEVISAISEFYGVSTEKALEYKPLMKEEWLKELEDWYKTIIKGI